MNNLKQIKKLLALLTVILAFFITQNAWTATWYSQGAVTLNAIGNWNSAADGSGVALGAWVNTDDYVVQGTHVLTFAAATFNTLTISSTGNHVTAAVTVVGNVIVNATCSPTAGGAVVINGNLTIQNGATLTLAAGFTANNVNLTDANLDVATSVLTTNGNVTLSGTSSVVSGVAGGVTFATAGTKTLSVSEDSYFAVDNLTINATVTVNTTSDFTITNELTCAGTLNATAGVATFNTAGGASDLWNNTGTLSLYDVLLNIANGNDGTPATNITIKGDLTKIGAGDFAPTAGTITFSNSESLAKNIQMVGGSNSFFNLSVATGSKVETSSSFSIAGTGAGAIDIQGTGSFIAQAGTITFEGNGGSIVNTGTLKFNNVIIDGTTVTITTASSFTINGNLTIGADDLLEATAGTITFENNVMKEIDNSGADEESLIFFNLVIADNSQVESDTDWSIYGNLTLGANSVLLIDAANSTYFDGDGTTQTITIASSANLEFGDVVIGNTDNPVVTTNGNFTVNGTAFTLTDAASGDEFTATGGTITFTDDCVITCDTDGQLVFWNILVDGSDVTDAGTVGGDFIQIAGNLTVNGDAVNGSFDFTTDDDSQVTFIGVTNSTIGGNSEVATPVLFSVLEINKTPASNQVILAIDVEIDDNASSTITLTSGILNLGSQTLTVGAQVLPTSTPGTSGINGATGTYVISTGHIATGLTDALFTIDNEPTLYNLDVLVAHTMGADDLTVNGNLDITGAVAFTIPAAQTLTLHGDFDNTGGGTIVAANAATSTWVLTGSGEASELEDATFGATMPSLNFQRAEILTGDLTFDAGNILTINTSVNILDIETNTLTFNNTTVLNLVSGSIKVDDGEVVFGTHTSQTTIPANLFTNNTVNNLTIAAATTLGGDLTINGTLTGLFSITTNHNTLTFGPNATLPAYVAATHIIGNLKRTVTNTATVFHIGGGGATTYRPLTLQFANAGSSQVVKISSDLTNPVYGRGGDPTKAVNVLWSITPEGTTPTDSLKVTYQWPAGLETETAANYDETVPVKWGGSSWTDYRNNVTAGAVADPRVVALSSFPVPSSNLSGDWTVFVAASNSNDDKDAAIAVNNNKLVITKVEPNPVDEGFPFSVTVQLQNQFGIPVNVPASDGAYSITFANVIGTATLPPATIPVGSNTVVVPGFSYATSSTGNQVSASINSPASPSLAPITPAVSPKINVLAGLPAAQVSNIILTSGTLSTTLDFTLAAGNAIILAKAGSAITSDEFPVGGTTYYASSNFGQGSTIGDAVVVYNGAAPGAAVSINGLAPNTTYYFRGFSYAGDPGQEKYLTFSAANNPRNMTTGGTIDDDANYGVNDTWAQAKPIGTNSSIRGTIKNASDEDWFSFSVSNVAPNIRTKLELGGALGNYNVDIYNSEQKLVRRGIRLGNQNESQVINDLPAGTYTVRIYGVNGANNASVPYVLTVKTSNEEIFSVTP